MEVFRSIPPDAPLIVAEAVWQYSHHVLAGLIFHKGPILTVANWSGQWPGLVGMLNLNGSLIAAGVKFSTLWREDFPNDRAFLDKVKTWMTTGTLKHEMNHIRAFDAKSSGDAANVGRSLAQHLRRDKAILGVFDEGCMGMFNAIVPDGLLNPLGLFKERLSQSSLYYAMTQVSDADAQAVFDWYRGKGVHFHFGQEESTELTERQVLLQCKMYIAAVRIADEFGWRRDRHSVSAGIERPRTGERSRGRHAEQRRSPAGEVGRRETRAVCRRSAAALQ